MPRTLAKLLSLNPARKLRYVVASRVCVHRASLASFCVVAFQTPMFTCLFVYICVPFFSSETSAHDCRIATLAGVRENSESV